MVERLDQAGRARLAAELPEWAMDPGGRDAIRPGTSASATSARPGASWRGWRCWPRARTITPNGRMSGTACEILLSTHDAGGLSERDVRLARAIDALLPQPGAG